MGITVDQQKCCGHARCLAVAPDAFDFDEDNEVAVVLEGTDSVAHEVLEQAVESCPERAISLDPA